LIFGSRVLTSHQPAKLAIQEEVRGGFSGRSCHIVVHINHTGQPLIQSLKGLLGSLEVVSRFICRLICWVAGSDL